MPGRDADDDRIMVRDDSGKTVDQGDRAIVAAFAEPAQAGTGSAVVGNQEEGGAAIGDEGRACHLGLEEWGQSGLEGLGRHDERAARAGCDVQRAAQEHLAERALACGAGQVGRLAAE